MFEIVLAMFKIEDKKEKFCYFDKIFLLANFIINVVLMMLFLSFNNVKMNFLELKIFFKNLHSYKSISIIKKVKLVKKKQFATIALNLKKESYIIYIVRFSSFN